MKKRELPYFNIGTAFGGSQSWFLDPWMHIGGCGALTMCDLLIYMACVRGRRECYPYDPKALTKKDYKWFGMHMKPYLRPRETGIRDLKTFIDGARVYLEYHEIEGLTLEPLEGGCPYEQAESAVRGRIDAQMPVPMLMLKHQDPQFDFFEWHWFLLIGYEEREEGFFVRAATYGKEHWIPFRAFWDTGFDEKGGLVLVKETVCAEKAGAETV